MKTLRWVLGILLGALALLVVGAGVLLWVVDPNEYKPWIERVVREATGRRLDIRGDLHLTVFPWLGTRVAGVRLANAEGFGDEPMVDVRQARVRVALMPLLKGELRADEVVLEGVQVRLARDASGRTNWADLIRPTEAGAHGSESGKEPGLESFLIGGIRIEDAAVHWHDAQTGTELDVAALNLRTGPLEPGRPVAFVVQAKMKAGEPAIDLAFRMDSQLRFDTELKHLRLEPLAVDLEAQGPALSGRRVRFHIAGPVAVDTEGPRVQWSGLRVEGSVAGDGFPEDGLRLALRTVLDLDMRQGTAKLAPLTLVLDGVELKGALSAEGVPDQPTWRLRLASEGFSPRKLLQRWAMAPRTADPKALETARLQVRASGGLDTVQIGTLSASLDDIHLEATGSVRHFQKPEVRFQGEIDAVDADRYRPPPTQASSATRAQPASQGGAEERLELPVPVLRRLDIDGRLKLGRLKLSGVVMRGITMRLRAKEGVLAVEPFGMALYGGTVEGAASVDVRGETPRFGARIKARSIGVGDLLAAVQGEEAKLRGTGAVTATLTTQGDRVSALKRALDGHVAFSLVDGALRDRRLARTLERVIAFLQGRKPRPAGEEILFESVRATGKIRKGVLRNDDLEMITPLVLAKGQGAVDIGAESVDYVLGVALAGGTRDEDRVFVPITVKGPFDDLSYGVDLQAVARDRLRHEAEKQIDEQLQNEIGKQLEQVAPGAGGAVGEALKKGLGGFLGR